jgi:competence protein ComEA
VRRALVAASMLALVLDASSALAEPLEQASAPPSVAAAAHRSSEGVVNLNDASENQLALLPGIGPGKARAISEHRHAHPFHRVDELTKVKGIGRKTFGRLRPYITTVGPTTLDREVKLHR